LTRLVQSFRNTGPRIFVNSRLDVALAAGAHGLHLPANSIPPARLRPLAGASFLIGVSCHCLADAERAEQEGADYVYLSPIYDSPSKPGYGPALGLGTLAGTCARLRIPVLALGGVDERRAAECVAAGAAGFASISAFATSE
jgi:thiamine-phosphate pyrophosphorylase